MVCNTNTTTLNSTDKYTKRPNPGKLGAPRVGSTYYKQVSMEKQIITLAMSYKLYRMYFKQMGVITAPPTS